MQHLSAPAAGSSGRWTLYSSRQPEPPPQDVTSYEEDVVQTLDRGFPWLYFPSRLEKLFERETSISRSRHLVAVGILWFLMVVAYQLLAPSERRAMPEMAGAMLFLRLGVVAPVVLGATFAVWWGLRPALRELAMAVASVVAPTTFIILVMLSPAADVSVLRGALTLAFLIITVVVRLRFWFAVAACLAIVGVVLLMPVILNVPNPGNVPLMAATVIATLIANYGLEREQRLIYLQGVLNRIRESRMAAMMAQLQELADRDPLTGVPNRRAMDTQLEALHTRREPFAVILVDVDAFKLFNDQYGHQAGDECLRRVAAMLRASLRRTGDSVSRVGGEEFAVVLPDTSLDDALITAERMRKAVFDLRIPHTASPTADVVTISAGVSVTGDAATPRHVISEADVALYQAKSAGRNRVIVFQRVEESPSLPPASE